jgi:hypothetical protein
MTLVCTAVYGLSRRPCHAVRSRLSSGHGRTRARVIADLYRVDI